MVLQGAHNTRMVGPVSDGRLEDNALVVALTLTLRLDAVRTGRPLLTALDPPLAAGEAAGLGPLPRLGSRRARGIW